MSSRRTKCDPEKETSQLMYEARMQYVTGHVDASVSTQDTSIWTIQIPEHLKPRQKVRMAPPLGALKGSGGRRPRTFPSGFRKASYFTSYYILCSRRLPWGLRH